MYIFELGVSNGPWNIPEILYSGISLIRTGYLDKQDTVCCPKYHVCAFCDTIRSPNQPGSSPPCPMRHTTEYATSGPQQTHQDISSGEGVN